MRRATFTRVAALAATALGLMGAWSCSKDLKEVVIPNQLPEVRLTSAPIDTSGRYFYSTTLNWVGNDPDGRVAYYLYAVDPPSAPGSDTAWVQTQDNEKRLTFTASQPDPLRPGDRAIDPHTFVIKAVDNDGAAGPFVYRSFFSFTVAPTVQIENPLPSHLLIYTLTPSVRINWSGIDSDGVFSIKPVRYKYRLFTSSDAFPISQAVTDPDSLRRYYAPAFAESLGWRSTSAETTQAQFTNLTPDQQYLFVLVGFDEAGAYSPVFSLTSNMLRFRVGFAGTLGPKIGFFNDFFNFQYATGGYSTAPSREVEVEIPENQEVTVNWFATAPAGSDIRFFRWALDIVDLADETPRSDELTDLSHWSTRSLLTTSATVGPFRLGAGQDATDHRLYVEAEDSNGLKSLGIVRFRVVAATFERELLIVDDTRLRGDSRSTGTACGIAPAGSEWPMAAELDTFLFARGNVPWKCYESTSTLSRPGIFAGYPFDTMGTRIGKSILQVPLAGLVKYKRIVWIVDGLGGTYTKAGTDPSQPMTALRYMTRPNSVNSVSTYVRQGGLLWVVGSGVAYTSLEPWNEAGNDETVKVWSSLTGRNELVPGRFMYDMPKWQSEIRAGGRVPTPRMIRYTGRFLDSLNRVGPSSPYASLPALIEVKTPSDADDPPPPGRTPSNYYSTVRYVEALQKENNVFENLAPAGGVVALSISQVYAGGGEENATYKNDFVELRNRSSSTVDLGGWGLHVSTGGTAWQTVPLSGTVLPGRHYLVALASGPAGADLPFPADATSGVNLPTSGAKIVLSQSTAPPDSCDTTAESFMDLFGYGVTDCYETRPFGGRLDATKAAFRRSRGCEDTNIGDADFYTATPSPQNTNQTGRSCFSVPVLDTLYRIVSGGLSPAATPHYIGMTYYHGLEHNPVVFTGFDIWGYRRRQIVELVDFVLGSLWGLQRAPVAPVALSRGASPDAGRRAVSAPASGAPTTGRGGALKPRSAPAPAGLTKSRWPWN